MTRKQAFLFFAGNYNMIKKSVIDIEKKYFNIKGSYHEDVTQDLFIKIWEELQKVEDKSDEVLKFLDRYYNGQVFNIYTIVKNMYINLLKREQKYVHFNYLRLSDNEKKILVQKAANIELDSAKTIQDKIDDYVKTFYWFDAQLFDLYRYEFKSHPTEMSRATKLSPSTIYRTVKRCKIRINDKLRKQYYEK
tara:strand:- start:875 stop:1450 length:576 start_codon:yes stop_codon:yes gene_type:complete